jgi:uncharacterized RDD family membrane protein YckC
MAGIGNRVVARILDEVIIIVGAFVLSALIGALAGGLVGFLVRMFLMTLLIGVVGAAYEITMTTKRGQTLGKSAVGIRVITAEGTPPRGQSAAIRWATPFVVQFIPVVGWVLALVCFLSAAVDPRRRGFHDKAAGTWVVAVPQAPPAH